MNNRFEPAPSPVSEALILICEKCGKKLATSPDKELNPAVLLQKTTKDAIRENFGKGHFRCLITSCMDVCPKERLTVAISPVEGADSFHTFELSDIKTLSKEIIELAQEKTNAKR